MVTFPFLLKQTLFIVLTLGERDTQLITFEKDRSKHKDTHFTNIRQTFNISAPFSKVNIVEFAELREVMVLLAEV